MSALAFDPRTIGLAAAPFQRVPSMSSPQPAPSIGPNPMTLVNPGVLNVATTIHRAQMEQAPSSQASVGSGYRWAILNAAATIGGHTFQAGTRIAVAPGQTSTSGGGKAHTTSTVTKVWAKFGQTFDGSSWVEGAISDSLFTYTGQTATWSSANGFGAGLGFTPDEATALQHQIDEAVLVASDRAGLQGKKAAEAALWKAAIAAGIGGGLLGAGTLWLFTRR